MICLSIHTNNLFCRLGLEMSLRESVESDLAQLHKMANECRECSNTLEVEVNVTQEELHRLVGSHHEVGL